VALGKDVKQEAGLGSKARLLTANVMVVALMWQPLGVGVHLLAVAVAV
jgi:hypothetical protein